LFPNDDSLKEQTRLVTLPNGLQIRVSVPGSETNILADVPGVLVAGTDLSQLIAQQPVTATVGPVIEYPYTATFDGIDTEYRATRREIIFDQPISRDGYFLIDFVNVPIIQRIIEEMSASGPSSKSLSDSSEVKNQDVGGVKLQSEFMDLRVQGQPQGSIQTTVLPDGESFIGFKPQIIAIQNPTAQQLIHFFNL
jgi:hypothetical protein